MRAGWGQGGREWGGRSWGEGTGGWKCESWVGVREEGRLGGRVAGVNCTLQRCVAAAQPCSTRLG